jgi:hypothetical protein
MYFFFKMWFFCNKGRRHFLTISRQILPYILANTNKWNSFENFGNSDNVKKDPFPDHLTKILFLHISRLSKAWKICSQRGTWFLTNYPSLIGTGRFKKLTKNVFMWMAKPNHVRTGEELYESTPPRATVCPWVKYKAHKNDGCTRTTLNQFQNWGTKEGNIVLKELWITILVLKKCQKLVVINLEFLTRLKTRQCLLTTF